MIHASEARQTISKKNQVKKETYKMILESFMKKIRVSLEANLKSVVLEVPVFVPGCPMFNRIHATDYLMRQLRLLDYNVEQISPFAMHVNWSKAVEQLPEISLAPSLANIHKFAGDIRRKNQR